MGLGKSGKSDTIAKTANPGADWPGWVRALVSLALAWHLAAIVAGAMAAPPSSTLERDLTGVFAWYHQLIDQGYAYRYYAPEPGPTPVAKAVVRFADGRHEQTVRLPERALRPRLRYQRQLALANHLMVDFEEARRTGDGKRSRWAHSYARHIAKRFPGCATVTLFVQSHLIPDPEQVKQALSASGSGRFDIEAEEFYTTPERIGEFSCDDF